MNPKIAATCIALISFFSFGAWSATQRFEVRDLSQRNLLGFTSDAPLEKVMGDCPLFKGWVELDPAQLEVGIKGELEVDLRSCQTGSGLRDLLIQEQIFDLKTHPLALIQLKKWAQEIKGALGEQSSGIHSVETDVEFRGTTVALKVPVKLKYFKESEKTKQRLPGNLLRLTSQMEFDLSKFGVKISEKYSSILTPKIEITLDLVGTDKLPNEKTILPEGPKPKERAS